MLAAVVAGVIVSLWALSRPSGRGGKAATIDGERYELQGAYDEPKKAARAATRIRRAWRKQGARGSVRVLRKLYRGTSPLWAVYARQDIGEESHAG